MIKVEKKGDNGTSFISWLRKLRKFIQKTSHNTGYQEELNELILFSPTYIIVSVLRLPPSILKVFCSFSQEF